MFPHLLKEHGITFIRKGAAGEKYVKAEDMPDILPGPLPIQAFMEDQNDDSSLCIYIKRAVQSAKTSKSKKRTAESIDDDIEEGDAGPAEAD